MATVPAPRTWTSSEQVTAAKLNTDVRDAFNFFLATPRAVMKKSTAQTIPNNALTAVTWDLEDIDTDSGHSNVTNNTRYTSQTAGWYHVCITMQFLGGGTTGVRELFIWKNGDGATRQSRTEQSVVTGAVNDFNVNLSGHIFLAMNDWLEVQVWQNSGGNVDLWTASIWEIRWVHS